MMNLIKFCFVLFILLLSTQLNADASDQDIQFEGKWCGKWDGIYKTCFTINKLEKGYTAQYQWEEHKGGGYQKRTLKGRQVNANTLNFEGKMIIIDLQNYDKASAVGVFKYHSRVAALEKTKGDTDASANAKP